MDVGVLHALPLPLPLPLLVLVVVVDAGREVCAACVPRRRGASDSRRRRKIELALSRVDTGRRASSSPSSPSSS